MGWKSAKYITRREAEELASMGTRVKDMKDWELEELLKDLGYGDDINLKYFGRSIYVSDMQAEYEED